MNVEQNNNIPQSIKDCYVVESGSTGTIELKDMIIEILRRQLNQIDLKKY